MLNLLREPLEFEFMRNALFTAIMLGVLCSVVGSYLIVQRMSLLGDVIAHAVLPGLAIAFFFGVDIFLGAFVVGILSTLIIAWIQSQSRVKVDSSRCGKEPSRDFAAVGVVRTWEMTLLLGLTLCESFTPRPL